MRIVIADDEAVMRLDLREMLTNVGHEVVAEAKDGRTALEAIRQHRPDLAILDVRMPDPDGIEVARKISREQLCAVVMLTAFSQEALVRDAAEAGAMAYVVKPFSESDLLPALEVAMTRFNQLRGLQSEVDELKQRLETRKLIERAKGVLMEHLNLTEAEAFRKMQRQAMESRKSMRQIAESILTAFDMMRR